LCESTRALALVGKRIGRFEILAVQGRGQFGIVYRARDTELARMVAVKVMRCAGRRDQLITGALFRAEAAAAARLQHPNIVTLFDHGTFEGTRYLVLELLEGETLRDRLARAPRLTAHEALAVIGDVTRALVEAHAAGVTHRDIKPSNVFLCTSGQVKVLDFGLARLQGPAATEPVGPAEEAGSLAQAGTPRYMAPELFQGHPADACSDVYAVGITLLELVAGPPELADGGPVEQQICRAQLAPRLRRLLQSATAARRDDRFQDAGELLVALSRVRDELIISRRTRRGRSLALAAALVAVAATATYRCARRSPPAVNLAVAVLGFDDLAGHGETAWRSTALSEMLDTDLASSPSIRVAPQDRVVHARADLRVAEGGGLDARALHGLRRYLGVEYTVTGSYLSVASGSGTTTRIDVQLRDADGQLLDSVSETGGDSELLDIMARVGSRLRVRLTGTAISQEPAWTLRASMPRTTDAIRLYAEGLRRQRSADFQGASDVLVRAITAEPEFPLAHSALSQVLHSLGQEVRMRSEAKLAFERSAGLHRAERLAVEARYREAFDEWPRALELRRALHEFYPDDLEYGLELAEALVRHEAAADARAVIAELRRLPPPWRDDPRIDICEASAHASAALRKAIAISAADKATALGARWILARARVRESYAERELGELDRSLAAAEESLAICEALGDREGSAVALFNAATTRLLRGDPISLTIAVYERGLDLERKIGHQGEIAWMLLNIAFEELMAGDPARAAHALDEAEPIATDSGAGQAALLRAMQWQDQGDLENARTRLEQARRLLLDTGHGHGYELQVLGEVLMAQGRIDEARPPIERLLALDLPHESTWYLGGLLAMSRLEIEAGHPGRAEALARETLASCERTRNRLDLATAQATLAWVLVAERRFDEARAAAETALALATHSEETPEWLDARIALARARFGLHPDDVDGALAETQLALDRARDRGLVGRGYEARLAAGAIAAQAHRADAAAQLRALAQDAAEHGFGLVARKAKAAAELAP
jgi:tetratricopeptide (TPR) repeat protein/TolB-like protein